MTRVEEHVVDAIPVHDLPHAPHHHVARRQLGERMRALFPRTRLVTLKGAGHWVHSEQPESFAATVRTFLLAPDDG